MESEEELYSITELIENAGYWLQHDPHKHARKLRLMQQNINSLSKLSSDANLIFLNHFLSDFIDRVWNNLAIDFTYQSGGSGREILDKLLSSIGKDITDLSNALRQEDLAKCYGALIKLTSVYQDTLHELKEREKSIKLEKLTLGTITNPSAMKPEKIPLYNVIAESGVITQSEYTLAGGSPSEYFFDIDKLLSKPSYIDIISEYFVKEINNIRQVGRIDKLAFIEKDVGTVGALPLMSSILLKLAKTDIEAFVVRLWSDVATRRIKGSLLSQPKTNECVGIVSDVATTSKGIKDTADIIREYGARTPYAFVLFDREQGAKELLKRNEIELRAILSRTELEQIGFVPPHKDDIDPPFNTEDMNVIPPAEWKIKIWQET